jgi:DNA (cytosine-5)-methyltransferase 1
LIPSTGDISHCLNAGGMGRIDYETETLITFDTTQITSAANYSVPKAGDPCHPLASTAHPPAVAFKTDQEPEAHGDLSPTLQQPSPSGGGQPTAVMTGMQVRRLTPRECERLQGFRDDYTLIPYRGKPTADGPRYKALGNSMAVPVMHWIGQRIQMVTDLDKV